MTWFEIVIVSIFIGLIDWFKNRKLTTFFKDFIFALITFTLLKLILSYIKLPDIPEKLQLVIFAGTIVLSTIVLSLEALKQNKQ